MQSGSLNSADSMFQEIKVLFNDSISLTAIDYNLSFLYYKQLKLKKGIAFIEQMRPDSIELKKGSNMNFVRNTLGMIYLMQGKYHQSEALFKQIINQSTGSDYMEIGVAKLNLSSSMLYRGKYKEAIDYLQEGIMLSDSVIKLTSLLDYYLSTGELYTELGLYEIASEYIEKAEINIHQVKERNSLIRSLLTKLKIAINQADDVLTDELILKISTEINQTQNYIYLPEFFEQKIALSFLKKDTIQTVSLLDSLLKISLREGLKYHETKCYIYYASLFQFSDIDKTQNYIEKALAISQNIGNERLEILSLEQLVNILETKKDYKNAFLFKKNLSILKDSTGFNSAGLDALSSLLTQLENNINEQSDINNEQTYYTNSFYLKISFAFILSISFYFFYKKYITRDIIEEQPPYLIPGINQEEEEEEEGILEENLIPSELLNQINDEADLSLIKTNKLTSQLQKGEIDWLQYIREYEILNSVFFTAIQNRSEAKITTTAWKNLLCLKLNFSIKESAKFMNVSPHTVKSSRYRLKQQLNFKQNLNFTEFIHSL